jgi:starvation-inducible DNA-binding protein
MDRMFLVQSLSSILATTYTFQLKAHKYHWNVEGSDFLVYHKFFGKIYTEAHDATDLIAESIRTLDALAPGSLDEFNTLSAISCDTEPTVSSSTMLNNLEEDNLTIIELLKVGIMKSQELHYEDVADLLITRLAVHEKHKWMFRSMRS